jgi:hypothetical protein
MPMRLDHSALEGLDGRSATLPTQVPQSETT